ncbi:MAG: patatin-like phospholipase family protein [Bacteroidota bacterium]
MPTTSNGAAPNGHATTSRPGSTIALALAGGGGEGAIYEIGTLRALDEAIEGLDFTRVPIYVGVSAGAFVASCLANGLTTSQLCRSIVTTDPGEHPFQPERFLMPAFGEFLKRGLSVPGLLFDAFKDVARNPTDLRVVGTFIDRLTRAVPVGLFANDPLRAFLERVFKKDGRTNDFRRLRQQLYIVAADLDSGEAVRFGEPGLDHVPIARAVQASTALPGLYPPVEIEGNYYVDGVLLKTMHASVALEKGADLVLCVNPIVPVDLAAARHEGFIRPGRLVDLGMPAVMSQTLRTLVHSRLNVGLAAYEDRYAGRDVLLFEPRRDDTQMFFTNIFSFSQRRTVCEHAYRSTLANIRERREEISAALAPHGLRLRDEVINDLHRDLWANIGLDPKRQGAPTSEVTQRLRIALHRLDTLIGDRLV